MIGWMLLGVGVAILLVGLFSLAHAVRAQYQHRQQEHHPLLSLNGCTFTYCPYGCEGQCLHPRSDAPIEKAKP